MKDLAKRLELKPFQLYEILNFIKENKPTNKELIYAFGFSNSYVKKIKRVIGHLVLLDDRRIILNKKGERILEKGFDGSRLGLDSDKVMEVLGKYRRKLPKPKREFDQFRAVEGTVIKRVKFMLDNEDLYGRDLIFLGDSDLTSIASSMTGMPRSLTVLDIDGDTLDLISEASKAEGLGIKIIEYDIRNRLPRSLEKRFDIAFSDPPFTPSGFKLFLQRSLDVVKDSLASSIYICYGTSNLSRERSLLIQEIISDAGLLILDKRSAFNEYERAESIGSRSDIYLLGLTPKTRKRIYNENGKGKIYTHQ